MEDAVREFQAVLEKDAKNARALFRLGLIAFRQGKLSDAIDLFDRMPEAERNSYSVLRNRALALEHLFRYPEAIETLAKADKVRPGDPAIALARGIVKLKSGDVPGAMEALRAYRTSPQLKKPSALYYAYTSLAASLAGEVDYAIQVGREGLTQYPACGPLLVNAGAVLERKGESEAAEALYARAVQAQPVPAQAHKNLGDQAWARGDQVAARVHYEKAVKIEPRLGDDIYLRLGNIAYKDQDLDVARLLWRRALELNPQNGVVRANLESLS
jgi:tetratricopeptide (TPR) repeat protein